MGAGATGKIDKANIEDILALTPIQEGMLYHYATGRDRGYYIEQLRIALSGAICAEAFRQAWQLVTDANDALRTVFRWEKLERPVQIVLKCVEVRAETLDASGRPEAEQDRLSDETQQEALRQGLDLQSVPFRVQLVQRDSETADMIMTWHHIVYDGWSNGIVLEEFFQAYRTCLETEGKTLLPLPVKTKYKEFVKWHQQQDREQAKAYWRGYLADMEERTLLPGDQGRETEEASGRGVGRVTVTLPPAEAEAIRDYARSLEATPAALLYSVWGLLLQKYNRSRDVTFGTTVSGRVSDIEGIDRMVGLFINSVPLRVTAEAGMRAADVVKRVDEALKRREPYEGTPLADIAVYGGTSRPEELFGSLVVLENYPLDARLGQDGPLRVTRFQMHETTHYPLTLGIQLLHGVELELAYDTARFSRGAVERTVGHFREVLGQMIQRPGVLVDELELLTSSERKQILFAFNGSIRAEADGQTVHGRFEHQAAQTPEAIAVIDGGRSYSYRQINERANGLAYSLRKAGVRRDQPVAVLLERSAGLIAAILGVLKAGGAYIPIDRDYTAQRIEEILEDSAAQVLMTQGTLPEGSRFAGVIVDLDKLPEEAEPVEQLSSIENPELINSDMDSAYIIYTSGSTGKPKGVVVEHRHVLSYAEAFQSEFGLDSADVVLQQASASFDVFVEEVFPALLHGASIVVARRMDVLDIGRLTALIRDHGVTVISCSPLLLSELNGRDALPGVRLYISGGDVLKYEQISQLAERAPVYNTYGPTEATVCAAYHRWESGDRKWIPIGRPIANSNIYILGPNGELMPIGIPGEICIAGRGVARGYWHREALTAQQFVPDPFRAGGRMYRSGDLGRWLEDGRLQFMGRLDEQVKVRGFRVEPGEIEHHLLRHEAVAGAVVLTVPDAGGMVALAAYIQPQQNTSPAELRRHLGESLPHYMIPAKWFRLDRLPYTANGKVDKKALLRHTEPWEMPTAEEDASSETELAVREAWKAVLGLERVGLHENFFDIGGSSVLLMQLHTRLEKQHAWGVTIADLFSHPTIARLAAFIDGRRDGLDESIFGSYQPLPADFFEMNRQAVGLSTVRMELPEVIFDNLKQIAGEHEAAWVDILLSMYLFLFTQLTGTRTASVQWLQADGETTLPLAADFDGLANFEQLFHYVRDTRRNAAEPPAVNAAYEVGKIQDMLLHKEEHDILPFAATVHGLTINSKFLEVFDAVLLLEETDEETLQCTLRFNDRRLKKEKMHALIQAYVDLLRQLSQNYAHS